MPNDRTAQTLIQPIKPQNSKELTAVPAVPSFSFADANSILDIEIQADQLLGYINKLTSLADQACTAAIRPIQPGAVDRRCADGDFLFAGRFGGEARMA